MWIWPLDFENGLPFLEKKIKFLALKGMIFMPGVWLLA